MRQLPRLFPSSALAVLCLLAALPARAQTATLVADLNTWRQRDDLGSWPRQLVAVGGKVFFVDGSAAGAGAEVWVSDGTSAGTEMLVDACSGSCSSDPRILGTAGGLLFWVAISGDGNIHYENTLWRSDGTRDGTFALTGPGVHMSLGYEGTAAILGDALYFSGCTEASGCELWKSDGTVAGTGLVREIVPGEWGSAIQGLTVAGSRLFFYARTPDERDNAVWVSDGTEAGTQVAHVLDDFYPGKLVAAGGKVFFTLETYPEGEELWVSDGTEAGSLKLTDFAPDHPIGMLRAIGNRLYFVADDVTHGNEIWRTDGTLDGTTRVTEFGFYRAVGGWDFLEVGGRLVFVATDGISGFHLWATNGTPESTTELCTDCNFTESTDLVVVGGRVVFANHGPSGWQPWSSDGTREGTGPIPGVCSGRCGEPSGLVPALGGVLFVGSDQQIWRTDGTAAGTRRFTELPGEVSFPYGLLPVVIGPRIYVFADAGGYGQELWVSDGQPGGTRLVANLGLEAPSSDPSDLVNLGDRLLFTACSGLSFATSSGGLWQSTGSAESTLRLTPPQSFSFCLSSDSPKGLIRSGGQVFFWVESESTSRLELWRSDGTAEGTAKVTHLPDDPLDAPRLYALRDQVFFRLPIRNFNGPDTVELWKSDGTAEGTGEAFDLPAGIGYFFTLHVVGDELYIVGDGLWRTDGTAAGTRQILDENSLGFGESFRFARAGSRVVFFARAPHGSPTGKLWRTDGTAEGTSYVVDIPHDAYAPDVFSEPTAFQGAVYFFANAGEGRHALWRSDGTGLGTKVVREFRLEAEPGFLDPIPEDFVVAGNRLFFRADDGVHGPELWQTDGTAQGTVLVRDVYPGPSGSQPSELREAGGRLYFSAHDGAHGFELWQSDGTAAGTRLVQDIAPGPDSSYPQKMTATTEGGGRLFFSADDGYTGRELWTLPLIGPAGCQPSADHLCLGGGRFQVEARWRDFQGGTGTATAVGLTADTGYFWFFDAANVEVVVKVLDGQGVNGHRWVFYGALSSVEYVLTVTDTQAGATVRYYNPPGQLASVGDTRAFGPLGAKAARSVTAAAAPQRSDLVTERTDPKAATGACQESATRLCLNGGRFAVEASWTAQGQSGAGTAVRLTGDTGYFWFFGQDNIEVILKVLDGTALNDKLWVFYGALSDVEYTLTVTDTQTGTIRTYANPAGRMASVADTSAF